MAGLLVQLGKQPQSCDYYGEVDDDHPIHMPPGSQERGRLVGSRSHKVFPALIRLAKMRNAPGTPAGNSRNQEKAVNT